MATPSGSPICSTCWRSRSRRCSSGTHSVVVWRSSWPTTCRRGLRSLVLVNSIGGSAWRSGRNAAQRRRAAIVGLGAALSQRCVAGTPGDARATCDVRGSAFPTSCATRRAIVRVANLARRADLRVELERLRDRGVPITILWGTRDGIIPRESFEALCVASGVEGTVVEGSHSWLLADPQHFGEVITNDVRVAQAARDLERGLDHTKQRGLRRVPTLRRRKEVVVPPPEDLPRRRVIPRASSSLTSGSAYLRETPRSSRSWETVKPSRGSPSATARPSRRPRVDGRRDESTRRRARRSSCGAAARAARAVSTPSGSGGVTPPASSAATKGWSVERVDGTARGPRSAGLDRDVVERVSATARWRSSSSARSRPSVACCLDRVRTSVFRVGLQPLRRHDRIRCECRLAALAGQRLEIVER